MKHIFFISLSLLLFTSACNTSRKASQSTSVATRDTVDQRNDLNVKQDNSQVKETTKTDSTIGISPKSVEGFLPADDQKLTSANTGKRKPVYKEERKDGVTAWIAIDTNDNIRFGAKTDSITLVIKNLIREKETITRKYDSLANWVERQKSQSVRVDNTVIVKEKTWWGKNWKTIFTVFGVVVFVIIFIALKVFASKLK